MEWTLLESTALIGAGSFLAGLVGSLTGLGGGVVIVPLLTLAFGVDIRYAIGASLVSVIATSSGSAAAYLKEGFTNLRIGMVLEIATTLGAILGAVLAGLVSTSFIAVLFGAVLIGSAFFSRHEPQETDPKAKADPWASRLSLDGSYPATHGPQAYHVRRVPLGFAMMSVAGAISGLLGIGSGAAKVLAMDRLMRIPFKVSTTTSNFMIGVTAAASAGIYLSRGYIEPGLAMPVMLGVLSGSVLGARILIKARTKVLRVLFALVILALGIQMIINGVMGRL